MPNILKLGHSRRWNCLYVSNNCKSQNTICFPHCWDLWEEQRSWYRFCSTPCAVLLCLFQAGSRIWVGSWGGMSLDHLPGGVIPAAGWLLPLGAHVLLPLCCLGCTLQHRAHRWPWNFLRNQEKSWKIKLVHNPRSGKRSHESPTSRSHLRVHLQRV